MSMLGSSAQTLQNYLEEAKNNSPELQAKQFQYESALEKVTEISSIPNTKFSVGYFVQETETRVGAQTVKLMAYQNLPWFGSYSVKKEQANFNTEIVQNEMDFYERELFLEVKKHYYSMFELKATETILKEHILILNTFEKLALSELENNRSTMVDLLKIKIARNEVENKLKINTENRKVKEKTFNILLNRSEDLTVFIPETIIIKDADKLFNKNIISNNPKLLQIDNMQNVLLKSEEATKKEGAPIIGLGLDYVFVRDRTDINPVDNGKNIIMPMLQVSLPLFSKKYSSKRKQLQLDQKALSRSKQTVTNDLITIFENASADIKISKATIITQEKNIVQIDQAHKILLTEYETGNLDFEQILEIQQLKLKFKLNKIAAEREYATKIAVLEFLLTTI